MAKKKAEKKTEKKDVVALPLEWHIPEGIITPFATNMLIQTIEHEFKISFFEVKPTIRINDSDPLPSKVRADYIAGVIVSAERLPNFIKALESQLKKYNSAKTGTVIT